MVASTSFESSSSTRTFHTGGPAGGAGVDEREGPVVETAGAGSGEFKLSNAFRALLCACCKDGENVF